MSSSSSSSNPPTQKDLDCAFLARDVLFPLKIQRDGSHPQQFPASEAVARVRDAAMAHDEDRAASSFFPRGIVVVHNNTTTSSSSNTLNNELQWNGQPDIDTTTASVSVIPQLLSVRACVCGDRETRDAYIVESSPKHAYSSNNKGREREIVLCSDKLMKKDYHPSKSMPEQTPQSLVAVETALAHQVTKVGLLMDRERRTADASSSLSCSDVAAMEVQAARAAECYYRQTKGIFGQNHRSHRGPAVTTETKRGPALGHAGFSWYPTRVQTWLQERCIRAVATRAATVACPTRREASSCVASAMRKNDTTVATTEDSSSTSQQ